jgi:MFS family permease
LSGCPCFPSRQLLEDLESLRDRGPNASRVLFWLHFGCLPILLTHHLRDTQGVYKKESQHRQHEHSYQHTVTASSREADSACSTMSTSLDIETASNGPTSPLLTRNDEHLESSSALHQHNTAHTASWAKRRRSYILVYSAIFCVAYVTSLDANTGFLYLNFACSEFGALASFSTIAIVQQLCFAIAKPPIAKISDVFGRAEAYLLSLAFYVFGYLIVSTAPTLPRLIGGIVFQATGTTGIQVLQSIIIADSSTAKWRGLIIGIVNLPYLINFAVAGPLVELVMTTKGWRFGFFLWTIILPISALPLLITLIIGQRRARRAGLLMTSPIRSDSFWKGMAELGSEVDAIGLLLFSGGFLLLLVPLSEAGHGLQTFGSSRQLLSLSVLVLAVFAWWETKAKTPILPYRFLVNTSVVCICLIGVLDFASFYLSWTYLSAFIQVLKGWDQTKTGYFASTQNVTSTVIGIFVGWSMAATRKYKFLLLGGIIVRLIGVSMMIRFRSNHSPAPLLILCQLLQGIGGGSVAITMQVAVQCVVRHSDVAIVTAIELLMTECGAAIGSAVAGMVFTQDLPTALAVRLPSMSQQEIDAIYGSLSVALAFPIGSETREAIIEAWVQIMHKLCIIASLILIPAVFLCMAIPDGTLPDVLYHRPDSHHHHHHHQHHHQHRHGSASSRPRRSSLLPGSNRPSSRSRSVNAHTETSTRPGILQAVSRPSQDEATDTMRNFGRKISFADSDAAKSSPSSEREHLLDADDNEH